MTSFGIARTVMLSIIAFLALAVSISVAFDYMNQKSTIEVLFGVALLVTLIGLVVYVASQTIQTVSKRLNRGEQDEE